MFIALALITCLKLFVCIIRVYVWSGRTIVSEVAVIFQFIFVLAPSL